MPVLSHALALVALAASPPNVVLITIDTLRVDRLGAYGYLKGQTPTLDKLARDGVLAEDAVVQIPQTRPSHASLFTGRLPYEHGIRDNASPPLDARWPTLAESLRREGLATAAFIGAYPVSRDSGLNRGFDHFDDPFGVQGPGLREPRSERRAQEVVDEALAWLERAPRPFFVWIHVFDPHAPYEAPPPFRERFAQDPYDGEVAYSDAQLARLLAWIDEAGLYESTLVVATSDHGEGLGDHGEEEHVFFVYDATLSVPLLLRWPGRLPAGARVSGQFRSIDLLPTLLELVGAPAPPTSGVSRARELRSGLRIPDNESYAESLYGQLHLGCAPLRSLRGEGWKYIDAPRAELYHVRDDPRELRNRLDDRSHVARAMRERLASYDTGDPAATSLTEDPERLERLAALGYVGGGFFSGPASGVDPKDRIADFQRRSRTEREAVRLFRQAAYESVVERLQGLVEPGIDAHGRGVAHRSYNASFYLGRSLLELRRFDEAAVHFADAVALAPKLPVTYVYLSRAQAAAGQATAALRSLEQGLAITPGSAALHLARGRLLLARDRVTDGRAALERARALDPDDAATRVALADLHRGQTELPAALAEAQTAVRLAPDWAGAHVALALALGALGREQEAGKALKAALQLEPDQPDALFYRAAIERRAGRPREALPLLERLVGLAPDYPGAREALELTRAGLAPPAPGTVRLRLLRTSSRARLEAALQRVQGGESFADVVRQLSEDPGRTSGGLLGDVRIADLAEPLRSAASRLQPGEMSPPLVVSGGFVVLMREPPQ